MKILVLSDSHSTLRFMRQCVKAVKPNMIIHLGDHYDDGQVLAEENPSVSVFQVPGNCDTYRCPVGAPEVISQKLCGVAVYATHGHRHRVKSGIGALLADARRAGAAVVLYGHTHRADCHREPDGLWVLNPGACGGYSGSAGVVEVENGTVKTCRILTQEDLSQ